MKTTTLNKIRLLKPCQSGWMNLLSGLGKGGADDEPLSLRKILEISGTNHALWAVRTQGKLEATELALLYAEAIFNLAPLPEVAAAIANVKDYFNGAHSLLHVTSSALVLGGLQESARRRSFQLCLVGEKLGEAKRCMLESWVIASAQGAAAAAAYFDQIEPARYVWQSAGALRNAIGGVEGLKLEAELFLKWADA